MTDRNAKRLSPPRDAVITAVCDEVTACVVTVNVVLVWPAGTVTDGAGTDATAGALLERLTVVVPPPGAGCEMKTVPVTGFPPLTFVGLTEIPVSVGGAVVPVTVKLRAADHGLTAVPLTASTRQKYVPLGMLVTVACVTSPGVLPSAAVVAGVGLAWGPAGWGARQRERSPGIENGIGGGRGLAGRAEPASARPGASVVARARRS